MDGFAAAAFSNKVVMSLEECIANHPINRSGRTKIFGVFHQLHSSEAFKSEWVNFLRQTTTTDPDPTFYQYVVGEIFDEIVSAANFWCFISGRGIPFV